MYPRWRRGGAPGEGHKKQSGRRGRGGPPPPPGPVQRNLRNGLLRLPGDVFERVDDAVKELVGDWWPQVDHDLRVQAGCLRQWRAPSNLAGEPAPPEWTPYHRADFLIERQRHQLPLEVTADERVVRLVRNVSSQAVLL
jgi:hypothetical protein